MAIDYSQYGDVSGIERRRALAKMLESGSAMPMANGGRIVPTYGLGNAAVDIGRILLGNKLAGDASAQEQAMKGAYTQAMKENDDKAYEALNGTPEYKPNNMVELPRPAIAPDIQKAAQLFGNNPQREALANMLIQGQVTKGVNTAKAVDDRETALQAPYDVSKLFGTIPAANLVSNEPLTNKNVGQRVGQALSQGGGVKTVDSGFVKDAATGAIEVAPLTNQQIADNKIKQDQLILDKLKLKYDNQFRQAGLDNDGQRIALQRIQGSPERQANIAAEIERAKYAVNLANERAEKSTNSLAALSLLSDYRKMIPNGTANMAERGIKFVWDAFATKEHATDARAIDSQMNTTGDQLGILAQRFPGVQTDRDYVAMKRQIGVLDDMTATSAQKDMAAKQAQFHVYNIIQKYGSDKDKAGAAAWMENESKSNGNTPAAKPQDSQW